MYERIRVVLRSYHPFKRSWRSRTASSMAAPSGGRKLPRRRPRRASRLFKYVESSCEIRALADNLKMALENEEGIKDLAAMVKQTADILTPTMPSALPPISAHLQSRISAHVSCVLSLFHGHRSNDLGNSRAFEKALLSGRRRRRTSGGASSTRSGSRKLSRAH
jgi:hypothetical protein